jgi:hypothetical protein
VLSYVRTAGDMMLLVVLNLGGQIRRFVVPSGFEAGETLASTKALRDFDGTIAADEGMIFRVTRKS